MILQRHLPYDPEARPKLPGIRPLGDAPWLVADEAHAAQMAERDRLIAGHRDAVLAEEPGARPAVLECLDTVLGALPHGYARQGDTVARPDGVTVAVDRDDPLATIGRLVQEDVCILEKPEGADEHVLTAAALCFPAYWKLGDKIGRPLVAIHAPVPEYDETIAPRVQRLFDGIGEGRPLWRNNVLWTADPTLFRPEAPADRPKWRTPDAPYLRTERQCLLRLPRTRAVVFTIHTYVLARADAMAASPEAVTGG